MKRDAVYKRLKTKRRVVLLISIFIVLFLYIFRTEHSFIRAIGSIGLLTAFYLADYLFELNFKKKHYIFIILIAIISFPLGSLYLLYIHFDKWMHFIQPIIIASIIFFMVSKLKLELKWRLVFTFFIVVGILGIFEIGEYTLDTLFGFRLQGIYIYETQKDFYLHQSRIDDTMIDMILGILGTLVYVVFTGLFGKEKKELFKK